VRTIAIINQKGGCGKTTTAINLAGVFSRSGLRTLLVDLDPQSHCAAGLAIPEQRIDVHIGDAMMARDDQSIDWTRLLWRVSRNLDLAPSTVRLAGLESARGGLASVHEAAERRLLSVLSRIADQYDVCLIDCPPAIGLLTFNALVAATEVLIPVETAFFSLQGATKQASTIKALGKRLGVTPPYRVLATMHSPESTLSRDLLEELRKRFEHRLIPTVIRFDAQLRESVSFGQPVVEYAPQSMGAEDYLALGRWLVEAFDPKAARRAKASEVREEMRQGQGEASPVKVSPNAGETLLATRAAGVAVSEPMMEAVAELKPEQPLSRAAELAERAARLGERTAAVPASAATPSVADWARLQATARVAREAASVLFGVRPTGQGMLFVQPAGIGAKLSIAGEFNRWSADAHPMTFNAHLGVFEACIQLTDGDHQYRLVVDGRWITDPNNPAIAPNPFGDLNSVVSVSASVPVMQ